MIYEPWSVKLLGFVPVDESDVWIYDSLRKSRSYDYCVNSGNVERIVSFTIQHEYVWIVYDYANDIVLIESLFS